MLRIYRNKQSSKESTSHRYLFQCQNMPEMKYHVCVKVFRLRDSITQTWFALTDMVLQSIITWYYRALVKNICLMLLFLEILLCLSKIVPEYIGLDNVGIEHSLVVLHYGLHGLLQSCWAKLANFFCYDQVNIFRTDIARLSLAPASAVLSGLS